MLPRLQIHRTLVSQGTFTPGFISTGSVGRAPNHSWRWHTHTDRQRLFFFYLMQDISFTSEAIYDHVRQTNFPVPAAKKIHANAYISSAAYKTNKQTNQKNGYIWITICDERLQCWIFLFWVPFLGRHKGLSPEKRSTLSSRVVPIYYTHGS